MHARLAVTLALCGIALLESATASAANRSARTNFLLRCSGCHGINGDGTREGGIPQFRNFVGAFASDEAGRTYVLHVPGVSSADLSNAEIADVMNYIMKTWGGTSLRSDFVEFTADEVAVRRAQPVADVVLLRREIVQRLTAAGVVTAEYPWP